MKNTLLRRKEGQSLAEMREKRDMEDAKKLAEERRRQKIEDQKARKAVLDKIKQDRYIRVVYLKSLFSVCMMCRPNE